MSGELPEQFSDLAMWLDWARPTMAERSAMRSASSMTELQAFYDAMLPRLGDVLEYLSGIEAHGDDPAGERLLALSKALAEVAPAVELFGEPTISYGYDVARFTPDPE